MEEIKFSTISENRDMVINAWGKLQSLDNLYVSQVNKSECKVTPEYSKWIKQEMELKMKKSIPAILNIDEQISELKKELEDHQLQLIVANRALENAKIQLKKEAKKAEKLEQELDTLNRIQEGIRKLKLGML